MVQDGSASIDVGGQTLELSKDAVLYLQPGATRSMKAGANGWKAFEVYSPVRLDHLALAGQKTEGVNVTFPDQGVTPSLPPGVVVNAMSPIAATRMVAAALRRAGAAAGPGQVSQVGTATRVSSAMPASS